MKEIKGDAIDVFMEMPDSCLIHQVNCQGKFGAGLAKQIKAVYPQHYEDYLDHIFRRSPYLMGTVVRTPVGHSGYINGIFGQFYYGRQGRYTNYAALFNGLTHIGLDRNYKTLIIPKNIGCGLGGGDWDIVHTFLYDLDKITKSEIIIVDGNGL